VSPAIQIDDQVYQWLQKQASPFVDSPNSVLRRVAGLGKSSAEHAVGDLMAPADISAMRHPTKHRPTRRGKSKAMRVPKGVLLPLEDYKAPLLSVLLEMGGSGPARTVIKRVGDRLRQRLSGMDRARYGSGGVRWENRVQFARLRLVEGGLIEKESPKGTWELTAIGRSKAASLDKAS
jgi:hypothetical protein